MATIVSIETMAATTITVSQATRRKLEYLKSGGQTYDDVIEMLLSLQPQLLSWAEMGRRIREDPRRPISELIAKSHAQPY